MHSPETHQHTSRRRRTMKNQHVCFSSLYWKCWQACPWCQMGKLSHVPVGMASLEAGLVRALLAAHVRCCVFCLRFLAEHRSPPPAADPLNQSGKHRPECMLHPHLLLPPLFLNAPEPAGSSREQEVVLSSRAKSRFDVLSNAGAFVGEQCLR